MSMYEVTPVWRYMTEDEIVSHLLHYNLAKGDKEMLREKDGAELQKLDDTLGAWIRNTYRMYESNNPYFDVDNAKAKSLRIIERVWVILTGKELPTKVVVEEKDVETGQGVYSHPDWAC